MMRTTVYPLNNLHMKPAFWGVERDLKDVLESIDSVWNGVAARADSEFKETAEAYFLSLDMPGVNKANLEIEVDGEKLRITGTRKRVMPEGEDEGKKISHTFLLPKDVDSDKIEAHCEDGVVYLALTKAEKSKPKKIEISQAPEKKGLTRLLTGK